MDVSHDDIIKAVRENTKRLDAMEKKIDVVEDKVDNVQFPDDWIEILRDVAAVGRTGRLVKRIAVWGLPLAMGAAAVWHWVSENNPFGDGT